MVTDLVLVGFSCFYKGYKYIFFVLFFLILYIFIIGVDFIFQICLFYSEY